MIVTPFVGKQGNVVCSIDGALGLFDRGFPAPPAGEPVEIMICGALAQKRVGDACVVPALIVRALTEHDVLVEHKGFETIVAELRRTTASVATESSALIERMTGTPLGWITPGRTPVRSASNGEGRPRAEPIPAKAYVNLPELKEHGHRIVGVPSLEEIALGVAVRLPRRLKPNMTAAA